MPTYTTKLAGLSTPIVTSFPIEVAIVPASISNVRSGITASTPRYWVQHETGNYNNGANADGEKGFLHSGAGGATTSYHFTVDNNKAIQLIPINEVSWQAADGGGPGNMNGISCELCVGAQISQNAANLKKSRNNAEELCAAITKAMGVPTSRVKRHWDFNYNNSPSARHYCPELMMSQGYWNTFVANVGKLQAGSTAGSGTVEGGQAAEVFEKPDMPMVDGKAWDGTKTFTSPTGVTFNANKRSVTTQWNANTRKWASITAGLTSDGIKEKTKFNVLGWVNGEDVDGEARWWIKDDGSRVHVGVTVEDPADSTPKPSDPSTENPDTSTDQYGPIVFNGGLYYRVGEDHGKDMEVTKDANLYFRADKTAKVVGTVKKGDKVHVRLWCAGGAVDGETYWWIIEPTDAKDYADMVNRGARLAVAATAVRPD